MKSRFATFGIRTGRMTRMFTLLAGVALLASPLDLFGQDSIRIGNGNTSVSLSAPESGSAYWKKPSSTSSSTTMSLQEVSADPGSVRLVRFDSPDSVKNPLDDPSFSSNRSLPSLPSASKVEPVLPTLPDVDRSGLRNGAAPAMRSTGSVKAPEQGQRPSASPFSKEFARGTYSDECPDPKSLPSIRELSYKVTPTPGLFPESCPLPDEVYIRKAPTPVCFTWKASNLCYKPLYFEDVQLERYGHSISPLLQPAISRVRFWLTIPILPYLMGVNPPNECIYDLGYYRPGNCAPYMLNPVPISLRGGLIEAGVIVGGIYLFP